MSKFTNIFGAVTSVLANVAPTVTGVVQNAINSKKMLWDQISIAERKYIIEDLFNDAFSGKYGDQYRRHVELNIMQFQISNNGKIRKVNDLYEFFQRYPVYEADYKQREIRYKIQINAEKGKRSIYIIFGALALLAIVGVVIAKKYGK